MLKFCKIRNPQSGELPKTPMSGNPRMCVIIGALQVVKYYWFSETAKCRDCVAGRFSNSAKVRNPQSRGFSNSAKVRSPQSGELSNTLMSGNPLICEITRALQVAKHDWFSEIAKRGEFTVWRFSNSAKSETPKVGDSQILQNQKPPQWGMIKNANVGESTDLRDYKSFTRG